MDINFKYMEKSFNGRYEIWYKLNNNGMLHLIAPVAKKQKIFTIKMKT